MTFDSLFHRAPYTMFQNTKRKKIIELSADETLPLVQKLRASTANQNIDCPVRNIKCVNEFGPAAIYNRREKYESKNSFNSNALHFKSRCQTRLAILQLLEEDSLALS